MEKDRINLNSHTTTPICKAAIDRMSFYLANDSMSSSELELRYQDLYELFGASFEDTFLFTSSAAEAINQVFLSVFLEVVRKTGKCHLIASHLEDGQPLSVRQRPTDLQE